jgi:hypothetical protein
MIFLLWNEQYAWGRFDSTPSKEATLENRVRQLEQLVGRLTMENKFLKKAVQRGILSPPKKSVESGCQLMNLPRSAYYHKPKNYANDEQGLVKWLHSSLGYRPPVESEELFMKTQNPCPTALTGTFLTQGCSHRY